MQADRVILATGGTSYPQTGSTGDGIAIARKSGHRIIKLRRGLVPLVSRQRVPSYLDGFLLKNVRLITCAGSKKIKSEVGEVVLRSFGISGALPLSISNRAGDWLEKGLDVYAEIDLKPGLTHEQLSRRLIRDFKGGQKEDVKGVLSGLLPGKFIDFFIKACGVNGRKKVNQVTQVGKGLGRGTIRPQQARQVMAELGRIAV